MLRPALLAPIDAPNQGRAPDPQRRDGAVDLGLDTVVAAMAGGDRHVADVAGAVLRADPPEPATARYRQAVLTDFLAAPKLLADLEEVTDRTRAAVRDALVWRGANPSSLLYGSVSALGHLLDGLHALHKLLTRAQGQWRSAGLSAFADRLIHEVNDALLAEVADELAALRSADGVRFTAGLGRGNRARALTPHRGAADVGGVRARLRAAGRSEVAFTVGDRDEAGAAALEQLRGLALAGVALTTASAADGLVTFFDELADELAFYRGGCRLHARLSALGLTLSLPEFVHDPGTLQVSGLADPALALTLERAVTVNDVDLDGARLVCVTGANQGGKSTFLRSLGLAALLAHAGLHVPAARYVASPRTRVLTHFPREEDPHGRRGRLDDELVRMRALTDALAASREEADAGQPASSGGPDDTLVLLNESFSSTNEREGSAIARGVVTALADAGALVVFVTHLHEFASGLAADARPDVRFLVAERRPDGQRTFRIVPGAPAEGAHGRDLAGFTPRD